MDALAGSVEEVHAEIEHAVGAGDTAQVLGSGDVPVLGTPRLIAWLEAATVAALEGLLAPGSTSVGTRVDVRHRAPSAIGDAVRLQAQLVKHEGNTVEFTVRAHSSTGAVIADGTIARVIVDRARFLGSQAPS